MCKFSGEDSIFNMCPKSFPDFSLNPCTWLFLIEFLYCTWAILLDRRNERKVDPILGQLGNKMVINSIHFLFKVLIDCTLWEDSLLFSHTFLDHIYILCDFSGHENFNDFFLRLFSDHYELFPW